MERERRPLLRRPAEPNVRLGLKTKLACGAVLATEALERIAFYGIVGNLVLFLNTEPLNWMSYNAVNAMFIFTGVSYISSIFSGWLADAYLGKFKSVILFLLIYLIGYVFLPVLAWGRTKDSTLSSIHWCTSHGGSHPKHKHNSSTESSHTVPPATDVPAASISPTLVDEPCAWTVFLALFIIAIGNGGVKSNIAPFGADQVRKMGANVTRTFFNWFYWCINIGAFVSLGVFAYVQQERSFKWGYIAPNICLALALLVFLIGTASYVRKPAGGSVLSNVFRVLCEACSRRQRSRLSFSSSSTVDTADFTDSGRGCLDAAKVRYGGSFHDNLVDDVRTLGKILLVFIVMVPYWAVYFQMETTFPVQGLHMRLGFYTNDSKAYNKHSDKLQVPAAWLSLFDVIFLLFLLPLFDRVIYPWLDRHGYPLSLSARIIIGMCFAAAAVLAAGVLENRRLYHFNNNQTFHNYIENTTYYAADMSVLWQIPQYALIGVSEAFASVAGLELAYTCAPRSMVALIMGLFWFSQGLGSFLGTAIVAALQQSTQFFRSRDSGDINYSHLDYYFFLLTGLQILDIVLFVVVTRWLGIGRRHHNTRTAHESVSSNQNSPNSYAESDAANRSSQNNLNNHDSNNRRTYSSNGNTPALTSNNRSAHVQRNPYGESQELSSNGA